MKRLKVDILGLSEVKWPQTGEIQCCDSLFCVFSTGGRACIPRWGDTGSKSCTQSPGLLGCLRYSTGNKTTLCQFRGYKNRPAPFPARMSYEVTKPGSSSFMLTLYLVFVLSFTTVFSAVRFYSSIVYFLLRDADIHSVYLLHRGWLAVCHTPVLHQYR